MVSWEMVRNSNPVPFVGTVPTDLQRAGDFSQTLQTNGSPILMYDPLTTKLTNGQYVRDPFPGNVIPANRINPVGAALMSYYPKANLPGNIAGFNNTSTAQILKATSTIRCRCAWTTTSTPATV